MIQKIEIMRKVLICMLVWNLLLTAGIILSNIENQQEQKLHNEICMLEEIPTEELQ